MEARLREWSFMLSESKNLFGARWIGGEEEAEVEKLKGRGEPRGSEEKASRWNAGGRSIHWRGGGGSVRASEEFDS